MVSDNSCCHSNALNTFRSETDVTTVAFLSPAGQRLKLGGDEMTSMLGCVCARVHAYVFL